MSKEKIYEKLNCVFRNIFMDESINLHPETSASDIEDWDSLMHMVLLSEVEKTFTIKFGAKEATEMKNVGEMANLIFEKLQ